MEKLENQNAKANRHKNGGRRSSDMVERHGDTNGRSKSTRTPPSTLQVRGFISLWKMTQKRFESNRGDLFRNEKQFRELIYASLQTDLPVFSDFASECGIEILRFAFEKNFECNCRYRSESVLFQDGGVLSFERVAIPLCTLLTRGDFVRAPDRSDARRIFVLVWTCKTQGTRTDDVYFMGSLIECTCNLVPKYNERPKRAEDRMFYPETREDIFDAVCDLLFAVSELVTNASADDRFAVYVRQLKECADESGFTSGRGLDRLAQMNEIIQNNLQAEEAKKKFQRESEERESLRVALMMAHDIDLPHDVGAAPGPGSYNPSGPRNDNDKEDFHDICTFPTRDELLCAQQPFLPRPSKLNQEEEVEHFIKDPNLRHLDTHFRLSREEMIQKYRLGIQWFVQQNVLQTKMKHTDFRYRPPLDVGNPEAKDIASLIVLRRVEVTGLFASIRNNVCLQLQFEQIDTLKNVTKGKIFEWWDKGIGSKALQTGSLVCLVLGSKLRTKNGIVDNRINETPLKFDLMVTGVVVSKKEPVLFDEKHCRFEIALRRAEDTIQVMEWMSLNAQRKRRKNDEEERMFESVLVQVRGGDFVVSLEAVLSALQKIVRLPFGSILSDPRPDSNIGLPEYLETISTPLNFSALLKQNSSQKHLECRVEDVATIRQFLRDNIDDIELDPTQADSLAHVLTHKVSLVQGPPGTGKSFLGVHIVRTLLVNSTGSLLDDRKFGGAKKGERIALKEQSRPFLSPIVCITYTNHALDQFLESLLDAGMEESEIVRVGGRSKSQRLEKCRLWGRGAENSTKQTPSEYKRRKTLEARAGELENCIHEESDKIGAPVIKWKDIEEFLRDMGHEENFLDSIVKGRVNDAVGEERPWTVVGSKEPAVIWLLGDENWKKAQRRIADLEGDHHHRMDDELLHFLESRNPWDLGVDQRIDLWVEWVNLYRSHLKECLSEYILEYNDTVEAYSALSAQKDLRTLRKAKVVGLTTSGGAIHTHLLHSLDPKVIIVEEASEVLEAHLLASLTSSTQHLILIGDHLQLAPKVSYSLSRYSNNPYQLDYSMFERLVDHLGNYVTLQHQYRMRRELSYPLKATLYPNLENGNKVLRYPQLKGFPSNVWFFDHNRKENSGMDQLSKTRQGFSNAFEVEFIVSLLPYLIAQGYKTDDIAVITPYLGQWLELRKRLQENKIYVEVNQKDLDELEENDIILDDDGDDGEGLNSPKSTIERKTLGQCVRLATVDNFQGEEAKVIIVSTVRCNEKCRVGFLAIQNRVNVMMSRAQHGMIVLGSAATIHGFAGKKNRRQEDLLFHRILEIMEREKHVGKYLPIQCENHGTVTEIVTVEEMRLHVDGGCREPCNEMLECGHSCRMLCHPHEGHRTAICNQQCIEVLGCGHRCQNLCCLNGHHPCGPCKKVVEKSFADCGHICMVKCSEKAYAKCNRIVKVKIPWCGHSIHVECQRKMTFDALFHSSNVPISQIRSGIPSEYLTCAVACNARLQCGHKCGGTCGQCFQSMLTSSSDLSSLTLSGITRNYLSSREALLLLQEHVQCKAICGRTLLCGHDCDVPCCDHPEGDASSCPPCKQKCSANCPHSRCPKDCMEVCPVCAEPCTWECEPRNHRHEEEEAEDFNRLHPYQKCQCLCGVPCTRLPCDLRSSLRLGCNHISPTVCGERSDLKKLSKYCQSCATDEKKREQVDFYCMETLEEVNLDEDPLVLLDCGHAFCISSIDAQVKIELFYTFSTDPDGCRRWTGLKDCDRISDEELKECNLRCPTCRKPFSRVARYGRIIQCIFIRSCHLKHIQSIKYRLSQVFQGVKELLESLDKENDCRKGLNKRLNDLGLLKKEVQSNSPFLKAFKLESDASRALKEKGDDDETKEHIEPIFLSKEHQPLVDIGIARVQLMNMNIRNFGRFGPVPKKEKNEKKSKSTAEKGKGKGKHIIENEDEGSRGYNMRWRHDLSSLYVASRKTIEETLHHANCANMKRSMREVILLELECIYSYFEALNEHKDWHLITLEKKKKL